MKQTRGTVKILIASSILLGAFTMSAVADDRLAQMEANRIAQAQAAERALSAQEADPRMAQMEANRVAQAQAAERALSVQGANSRMAQDDRIGQIDGNHRAQMEDPQVQAARIQAEAQIRVAEIQAQTQRELARAQAEAEARVRAEAQAKAQAEAQAQQARIEAYRRRLRRQAFWQALAGFGRGLAAASTPAPQVTCTTTYLGMFTQTTCR
jgi:hypothetical protein